MVAVVVGRRVHVWAIKTTRNSRHHSDTHVNISHPQTSRRNCHPAILPLIYSSRDDDDGQTFSQHCVRSTCFAPHIYDGTRAAAAAW